MASHFGGKVGGSTHREYGHADVEVIKLGPPYAFADKFLQGLEGQLQVWMSHGDQISELPEGFHVIGKTKTSPFTAIAHDSKPFFGIQFHPEVTHTPKGKDIIGRFVLNICECSATWTMVR
jgi:GMP synthase (glutamine-hydrolysing)